MANNKGTWGEWFNNAAPIDILYHLADNNKLWCIRQFFKTDKKKDIKCFTNNHSNDCRKCLEEFLKEAK